MTTLTRTEAIQTLTTAGHSPADAEWILIGMAEQQIARTVENLHRKGKEFRAGM